MADDERDEMRADETEAGDESVSEPGREAAGDVSDDAGEAEAPAGDDTESVPDSAETALNAAAEAIKALNDETEPKPEPEPDATQQSVIDAVREAIHAVNAGDEVSGPQAAAADAATEAMGDTLHLPDFAGAGGNGELPGGLDLLGDVNLKLKVELGRTRMHVDDVLRLGEGSVVELDKLAGDPVDIFVNDRPVARGEVLVLNDNFCVRINEILSVATPEQNVA